MANYNFFSNKQCEYFPCHKNINEDEFNCLFCYCPLYLIEDCGGNKKSIDGGIKDCSNCTVPHQKEKYSYIIDKLSKKVFDI